MRREACEGTRVWDAGLVHLLPSTNRNAVGSWPQLVAGWPIDLDASTSWLAAGGIAKVLAPYYVCGSILLLSLVRLCAAPQCRSIESACLFSFIFNCFAGSANFTCTAERLTTSFTAPDCKIKHTPPGSTQVCRKGSVSVAPACGMSSPSTCAAQFGRYTHTHSPGRSGLQLGSSYKVQATRVHEP